MARWFFAFILGLGLICVPAPDADARVHFSWMPAGQWMMERVPGNNVWWWPFQGPAAPKGFANSQRLPGSVSPVPRHPLGGAGFAVPWWLQGDGADIGSEASGDTGDGAGVPELIAIPLPSSGWCLGLGLCVMLALFKRWRWFGRLTGPDRG